MAIHYEVLINDSDLGVIVRATNTETGASGIGASDPASETDLPAAFRDA